MRRRKFIALLGGAAAWPALARAEQHDRVRKIGLLIENAADDPQMQQRIEIFRRGLERLGWIAGQNVHFEYRYAASSPTRIHAYAAELAAMAPDIILAHGTPPATALQRETDATPIVFVQVADPVGVGLVSSLGQPGGNITGFTTFEFTIGGKWLQVLKEVMPGMTRAAVILDRQNVGGTGLLGAIQAAAPSIGVQLIVSAIRDAGEVEQAIAVFAREPNGGLVLLPSSIITVYRDRIIALAAKHRLPAVYPFSYFPADGGLMSYGPDVVDIWGRAATYFDRILKGAKPADLPVQQPTKFELVINIKTAKALGLSVPSTLLARADEVIE